jgi:hypothetical protein
VNGSLDTLLAATTIGRPRWEVWFLLHQLDRHRLGAELSRPQGIGDGGEVTEWRERILLPDPFGGTGPEEPRLVPEVPDVPVQVRRRVG